MATSGTAPISAALRLGTWFRSPITAALRSINCTNSDDFQFLEDVRRFVKRGCFFHRQRAAGQLTARGQAKEIKWLRAEQTRLETVLVSHEKAVTLQARMLNHSDQWLVFQKSKLQ